MKNLIFGLLIFVSSTGFAQSKITSSTCAKTSNEVIAKDLLNMVRSGDDEGKGNGTCSLRKDIHWVKGAVESFDSETKRIILSPEDLVFPVGAIVELQDDNGPTNVFKVNYQVQNAAGKKVTGSLTFSRLFEQSYIDELGCAVIQNEPTISFIDKSCL